MQLLYEIWQQLNESNVNIDLNKFDKNKVIAKVDVDYIIPGNSDEDNDGEIQFTEQGLVKTLMSLGKPIENIIEEYFIDDNVIDEYNSYNTMEEKLKYIFSNKDWLEDGLSNMYYDGLFDNIVTQLEDNLEGHTRYLKYYPATYWEPAEGGYYELDDSTYPIIKI